MEFNPLLAISPIDGRYYIYGPFKQVLLRYAY